MPLLGMKVAISGKGGVGKTTLASLLCYAFSELGYSVLAVDADPNATLAGALGFPHPERIVPIAEMAELIEERTGARPGQLAPYFKLNPRVSDIPEKYWLEHRGIKLMVMGRLRRGGGGCYCPENALVEALVAHLFLERSEVVIMDMEAGVEHLGRGTARGVDRLIVVVEPGRASVETARRIRELAGDLGLKAIAAVANKIRQGRDRDFLLSALPDFDFLGFIPYDQSLIEADLGGSAPVNASEAVMAEVKSIVMRLEGKMLLARSANQEKLREGGLTCQ